MSAIEMLAGKFGSDGFSRTSNLKLLATLISIDRSLGNELVSLLEQKNGFFAFESALHVYPVGEVGRGSVELSNWNSLETWKEAYDVDLADLFCFAENLFGEQFMIVSERICRFDPETAELEETARTLEDWAEQLLADPDYVVGHALAREWQETNGPLKSGCRLVPKVPFVCGGEFDIANLYSIESVRGMQLRGNLANQIANLPDGATIQFDVSE